MAVTLCPALTDAFDLEQTRVSNSIRFWSELTTTLEACVFALNRRTRNGRFCAETPSEHEFKIDYLGRELKLAIDHVDQRLYFYVLAATGRHEHNREAQNPVEAGILHLHHGPNGFITADTSEIWADCLPGNDPETQAPQQIAEALLRKLTVPRWC